MLCFDSRIRLCLVENIEQKSSIIFSGTLYFLLGFHELPSPLCCSSVRLMASKFSHLICPSSIFAVIKALQWCVSKRQGTKP